MVRQLVVCPYCQGKCVVKRGKTDPGKQRHRCQNCECSGCVNFQAIDRVGFPLGINVQATAKLAMSSRIRPTHIGNEGPEATLASACTLSGGKQPQARRHLVVFDRT